MLIATMAAAVAAVLPAAAPAAAAVPAAAAEEPVRTEVSFTSADGTVLHGAVLAPRTAAAGSRGPGLVMVAGAGPGKLADLRDAAAAYARRGIPTLVYDKRTNGYSLTRRDYGTLADDALAAVRLLRTRPDVDPSRVGLWGLSEGAWVVSLAATRSSDVSFLVTAGAAGLTPSRQEAWAYGGYLRHAGVSGSLLPAMQDTAIRQLVGAGLFPEADYDPVPVWERVHQPVLAEWGTLDREAAPEESAAVIRQALDRAGNTHYTLRTIPGVRHNLHVTHDDGYDRPKELPSDYADYESAWITRLGTGLPPVTVDPAPHQDTASRPLAPLAWYEATWLQAAVTALCLLGFAAYALTGAVRRVRRRPRHDALPRSARWAALAGTAAVLTTLGYLLYLAATAAALPGPVVLGRPVVWLAAQLLAVLTLATSAHTALRYRRTLPPGDRRRLAGLLLAAAVFVPWAAYWGLLRP
ncbi:alpha/beta hydrolase family protein [Kitasatospora aureofaciens]|uniref:alpha/beta hydrolase family protein n=1 Tax=Kitasatospora aureofaciens TaxID=1894 RepID=UPI0037F49931